ncbi:MAG: CoA activase [Lewinellaceae bacterium]|nr:CoA activase [Lewinellaceae bacterium]
MRNDHSAISKGRPQHPTIDAHKSNLLNTMKPKLYIGLDVGSTTVKGVVMDAETKDIIWQDYRRHETRQPEEVLSFLQRIELEFPDVPKEAMRLFMSGSGAMSISGLVGARFVQEVTAMCLAAEKLYPEVGSIIDLGGQDSKIIIFKENPSTGRKVKIPSMNDKCAGGTGAVIDKINAKLGLSPQELGRQQYDGVKLHHVAGKCGVFAETDINSLQKQGIPTSELMASLFEAIVLQNLTVLTRGHTLRPLVLLLGGPNNYIKGMKQAWQHHISLLWEERHFPLPENCDPRSLIITPPNALFFAAIGAVVFGWENEEDEGRYIGWKELEYYIHEGRIRARAGAEKGLIDNEEELEAFRRKYSPPTFVPATFRTGQVVNGFIGLDAGSTSTKAVLLSPEKEVLLKAYRLSGGNPIEDTKGVLQKLKEQVEASSAQLNVLGLVTTGYAKDVLKEVLCADGAIVETVAHTNSALHYYQDVDVICDIGGQDIKIMMLKDRQVKDFELNTQCSAGNGYFLQGTAESFGIPVEQYADVAFKARLKPTFSYGCAVFLQSDIVNFQRLGWKPEEILAGLAAVLPKNIWLYVAQTPNFAKLGVNFLLQGGTQHNLAAVKAQVDFIESRFEGKSEKPYIRVHRHCGESGAIGAGLEAIRLWENGHRYSTFIGLDATAAIEYKLLSDESTRCLFCKNKCLRTFIDIQIGPARQHPERHFSENGNTWPEQFQFPEGLFDPGPKPIEKPRQKTALISSPARRIIVGHACEKGAVEQVSDMRKIDKAIEETLRAVPNLVDLSLEELFKSYAPPEATEPIRDQNSQARKKAFADRPKLRIGIPRVLLMYALAPLFTAYFESLGIRKGNIIFSDFTSEKLFKEGGKRGTIDPCYPSKVTLAHVHNLLYVKHPRKALNMLFFPMIGDLDSGLANMVGSWVCPSVAPSAESVKASFTKEEDIFASLGITYVNPFLNMAEPRLFEQQMYETFQAMLGLTRTENARAIAAGYEALEQYRTGMRQKAREVLDMLERDKKIGIVLLGRPYHKDPGINHELFTEFQKLGYPILAQDILPMDEVTLHQVFGEDLHTGRITHPLDISDVWKRSLSTSANIKVWAAKFVARHPNLVAIEVSNFKCGHDAPTYTVIEEIIESSGTPFFSFRDIDENKPKGSIKLRIETIDYFLKQYRERAFGLPKKAEVPQEMDISASFSPSDYYR